jgi:chloramphenicol-sensitive protein RarD
MSQDFRTGIFAAASAYTCWGLLPLYLKLVDFASEWEVLAHRVLWSLPFALAGVLLMRGWRDTRGALAQAATWQALFASALLMMAIWAIYVWAVANDRVMEASLAYFITPLVNVAFGVTLFREPLRRLQAVALVVAALGVVVQGFALQAPPWVALALCATWSCYGLVRKQTAIPAAGGLLVETIILSAPAAILLWVVSQHAPLAFDDSPSNALWLALAGPATALPLILFAIGARRLPFTIFGLLQYIAPTLQFCVALSFGEAFTPLRAVSFALIWLGLAIFSWDTLSAARPKSVTSPATRTV